MIKEKAVRNRRLGISTIILRLKKRSKIKVAIHAYSSIATTMSESGSSLLIGREQKKRMPVCSNVTSHKLQLE